MNELSTMSDPDQHPTSRPATAQKGAATSRSAAVGHAEASPAASTARHTAGAPTSAADHLVRQLYGLSALRRELGRAATREIASHGFTALAAVRRLEPCRVSDVASELHVDLSVASRQIAALVAAGHVQRETDPDDRRAQLVSLTDDGFAVLVGAHERMVEQLGQALEDWSDDQILTLAAGIERLVHQFDEQQHAAAAPTHDDAEVPA